MSKRKKAAAYAIKAATASLEQAAKLAAVKAKAPTKVEQVIALCERKNGCTINDIVTELGVSRPAASSLIGDAKRKGRPVKVDAGVYRL
jgi:hypothetical protein